MLFMGQMLDRLAGRGWYCFLDGYSGYNQIPETPRAKIRPHSRVIMAYLPSRGCLSIYVMHQQPSKGVSYLSLPNNGVYGGFHGQLFCGW